MKYAFTTLAVGKYYEDKSNKFYTDLAKKTKYSKGHITTANTNFKHPNAHVNYINPPKLYNFEGREDTYSFHLNLKCLAIKHALELDFKNELDYIIFHDGDWLIEKGFREKGLIACLNYMEENEIDVAYEREAHLWQDIEQYKKGESIMCKDKIEHYDLVNNTVWQDILLPNEQFMIFKNNHKLKFFVKRWEQFLWYGMMNNLMDYPDALEIGVSIKESQMKAENVQFDKFMEKYFSFLNNSGTKHTKF